MNRRSRFQERVRIRRWLAAAVAVAGAHANNLLIRICVQNRLRRFIPVLDIIQTRGYLLGPIGNLDGSESAISKMPPCGLFDITAFDPGLADIGRVQGCNVKKSTMQNF